MARPRSSSHNLSHSIITKIFSASVFPDYFLLRSFLGVAALSCLGPLFLFCGWLCVGLPPPMESRTPWKGAGLPGAFRALPLRATLSFPPRVALRDNVVPSGVRALPPRRGSSRRRCGDTSSSRAPRVARSPDANPQRTHSTHTESDND